MVVFHAILRTVRTRRVRHHRSGKHGRSSLNACRYGEKTDPGRVRKYNEDAFLSNPELGLWLVADGMGGHESGEVASAIASRTILQSVQNGVSLPEALNLAHKAILQGVEDEEGRPGMGTTAVALRIQKHQYEIAWVGDSRAYLFWNGQLVQRSKDHTYVQFLVDSGSMTLEQAKNHPQKHAITRALGMPGQEDVKADQVTGQALAGARFLLCSDGLSGEVEDDQIAEILSRHPDNREAVDQLVQAALDNGGGDNVTVILVSAPDNAPRTLEEAQRPPRGQRFKRWALRFLLTSLAALFVTLVAIATFWLLNYFWPIKP